MNGGWSPEMWRLTFYLLFQRCKAIEGFSAGQTVLMTLPHFVPVLVQYMREEENGGRGQIRGDTHTRTQRQSDGETVREIDGETERGERGAGTDR